MHIVQPPLFDFEAFIVLEKQERLSIVLEALDAEKLLSRLERARWTGRKGKVTGVKAKVQRKGKGAISTTGLATNYTCS